MLLKLLTAPVSGPIWGTRWVLERVVEEAERQANDDSAIRAQLLEVAMAHERGEISDAELEQVEEVLLERLREVRARRSGAGEERPHG